MLFILFLVLWICVITASCKSTIIISIIKKGYGSGDYESYRPISCYLLENDWKNIATKVCNLYTHLINNEIGDNFQSVYKAGDSCEADVFCVWWWYCIMIRRRHRDILVLLYLSSAFDAIIIMYFVYLIKKNKKNSRI